MRGHFKRRLIVTPRQWDLMRFASQQMSCREIAAKLDRSEQTIKNAMSRLIKKFAAFGLSSKCELGILYILYQQPQPRKNASFPGKIISALAEIENVPDYLKGPREASK